MEVTPGVAGDRDSASLAALAWILALGPSSPSSKGAAGCCVSAGDSSVTTARCPCSDRTLGVASQCPGLDTGNE